MKKLNLGEETMAMHLKTEKIHFEREHKFHPERKWRFDFALKNKIAVEIEGGIWVSGAHSRGKHFESDCEKYNEAALLGWRVFRFSPDMVKKGIAINTVLRAITKECPTRILEDALFDYQVKPTSGKTRPEATL